MSKKKTAIEGLAEAIGPEGVQAVVKAYPLPDEERPEAAVPAEKFDESTVIISVNTRSPRSRAQLKDADAHVEVSDGTEPERESLSISKDLFKSTLFKKVRQEQRACREIVKLYALSSGDYLAPGCYLVPVQAVDKIFEKVDAQVVKLRESIEAFCQAYPQIKTDAQIRLKGAYDEGDFPPVEAVRESFLIEGKPCRVRLRVRGNVPKKGISRTIYERELANAQNETQGLIKEVRDGLRAGLLKLVGDLVSKVKEGPGEDGKRFVVGPKLDRVKQFLEALPLKDVTKDGELQKLAEKAREILDGVDSEAIRDDVELAAQDGKPIKIRDRIVTELGEVAKTLDGMVEKKPSRAITFEEDE